MLCTSRGVGQYVASEAHTLAYGRLYKPDASRRPVIYFTGLSSDRNFIEGTASASHVPPRLARLGVPFISAEFGGTGLWGNATTQTRIGEAWAYVKAALGTRTDKFIGVGVSKGATAVLNYARANPSDVAALVLIVPAVDVSDIYDNNRSGNAAQIDAAYGGDWAGSKATFDPALNTATHASQAIPMKLFYGGADTTCTPATITAFATAVGGTAVNVGADLDHLTVGPEIDPVEDVWEFVASHV